MRLLLHCLALPLVLISCGCQLSAQPVRQLHVAKVTATDSDGDNVPENMIDGVPGTRWSTGEKGAVVVLDLAKPATLTTCRIRRTGRQGRSYIFELATSMDGEHWQELGGERHSPMVSGAFSDYELPATEARYVRIRCLGSNQNSWTHIDDVQLIGTGGIPATAMGPKEMPEEALHRVGDETSFSLFSYYGTTPESPDGRRICYTRFITPPTLPKARFAAELWVCARDLSDRRKIADVGPAGPHNGAMALWLDNRRIVYQSGYHETLVVDADTGETLLGPLAGQLQHNAHEGRFLICRNQQATDPAARGLYSVDVETGEQRLILPTRALQPFAGKIGRDDPDRWAIQHVQWSADGSRIAFKLWAANGIPCMLFTCKADGSEVACFGPKPMHFQWYDGDTLFGHDSEVEDGLRDNRELRRWRWDGKVVETLAGYGCHPAVSFDRTLIATETWYGSDPVRLMLYRRGETKPDCILATMPIVQPIWTLSAHVNPSFSRDGKRVYFNRAMADGLSQAYYVDLP